MPIGRPGPFNEAIGLTLDLSVETILQQHVKITVQCPKLSELPMSSQGRTGWPWTEESRRLPMQRADGSDWPRISVVTPSFNQGRFIEETLRSILLQGYPNLEYFVLDGGSTDGTVEIIKKYSHWLTYWKSEPDGGQSAAVNRGLVMASGDLATWINSDDMLCKNALVEQVVQNGSAANTVYVGNCLRMDVNGKILSSHRGRVHSLEDLLRVKTVWRARSHIIQPEVLFPRKLALAVGALDCDNHFTMDYELWGKFLMAGARFEYTGIPFGMFRRHVNQKIQNGLKLTESLLDTATKLARRADCFSEEMKQKILADLDSYRDDYAREHWRKSGRLAQIGLPASIVNRIRKVRARLVRHALSAKH
jgi:glycosyltransferase involved in cell wall biosynthesis